MNWIQRITGGLLLLLLLSGCGVNFFTTADLRTTTAKDNFDAEKGQQLIKKMAAAHGVVEWENVGTYEVDFSDNFLTKLPGAHPFDDNFVKMKLEYIPNTFDGRATFEKGKPKGTIWGIQAWQTYTQKPTETLIFKQNKDITFWLPTYQYFIEFPRRILQANVVSYAGEKEVDGVLCEGIYATWKSAEKQRDIDQYLIWINKETGLIALIEYTVRDQFKFLTGGAYFKEMKDFNGIKIPTYMPVISNLSKGFLHEMRIDDLRFDTFAPELVQPNEKLKKTGNNKPE